jgi:hypothetical protein
MAYAVPYALTKIDIAALKACDFLWVGLTQDTPEFGQVDLVKRAPEASESNPFPTEARRTLPAPVTVQKEYDRREFTYECRAVVYPYREQCTEVASMLSILRVDDTIMFVFRPDARTTGDLKDAGFHHDVLYLRAWRKDKQIAEFGIYSCVSQSRWRLCRETAPVAAITDQTSA